MRGKTDRCHVDGKIVLVTGATGFVGQRLCARLREQGACVIGLARPSGTRSPLPRVDSWIEADLARDTPFKLPRGIDTVYHLAGKAHALAEVRQDVREYDQINHEGTRRIFAAANRVGVRAFVLVSTVKAGGAGVGEGGPGGGPMRALDESAAGDPDGPYGQSKRAAERVVLESGYIPHRVVLRPCLVYGPSPKGNLEKMIDAVRRGRFPPLPEVGNRRSMVHVDDLVEAALLAARHPAAAGGTYIVADNAPFSTRQLFEWICAALDRPIPRWHVPISALRVLGRTGDVIGRVRGRRFVFDSEALEKLVGNAWYTSALAQRELGWSPRFTIRDALPEMCGRLQILEGGRGAGESAGPGHPRENQP